MYNKFFGFKEKPFKLVPNPEYLFLSKSHEEALGHLTYAVSQGDGFVEITGEVGTGKTTLCRAFLDGLDESVEAAYIFNPKLDALQLLKTINDEFSISSAPDNIKELIDILNVFLIEQKAAGNKTIVLIDEAQNLSKEVLEQLRLLSNLETTQDKLLQIILVGQPELGEMLGSHELRQLGQRITINCNLSPLSFQETTEYIRHRIALASHRAGPQFDRTAYRAIYKYSRGIPRLINIACDRALLNGFSRNSYNVTGSIAKEAIKELTKMHDTQPSSNLQGKPAFTVLATVLIISLILLLHFTFNAPNQKPVANKVHETKPAQPEKLVPEKLAEAKAPSSVPQPQQAAVHETPVQEPKIEAEQPLSAAQEAVLPVQPKEVPRQEKADPATLAETKEAATEDLAAPVSPPQASLPQRAENVLQKENEETPVQKQENAVIYSVHAGSFSNLDQADKMVEKLRARNYPSFLYTRTDKGGNLAYVVVAGKYNSRNLAKEASSQLKTLGFDNFVSRAKHSLYFGPSNVKITSSEESKKFQDFLYGLNSRHSRNSAMQEALKLWLPGATVDGDLQKINADRAFFKKAAEKHDQLIQPIAADLIMIQRLNLPTILAIYLPNHLWPKYLTITGMDDDLIIFAAEQGRKPIITDWTTLQNYWSGEAFLLWKDYLGIDDSLSKTSRNNSVKAVKQLLFDQGHTKISINQTYDKYTQKAIMEIQKKYGLREDGIVGPLTKIALYSESDTFKKPSLTKLAQN